MAGFNEVISEAQENMKAGYIDQRQAQLDQQMRSAVAQNAYQARSADFGASPQGDALQQAQFANSLMQARDQAQVQQLVMAAQQNPMVAQQLQQAMAQNPALAQQIQQAMQGQGGQPNVSVAVVDTAALLAEGSEPTEKEVSLETLSDDEKSKILRSYINCRDIAEKQYTEIVEPKLLHRKAVYEADVKYYDKKFPQLSKSSKWVSKDVKTACEWIMSSMMEAFTGSDEPISVKGVSVEDDETAALLQQLIRYQLEKKNNYYQFIHSSIKYALSENFSVAKVWWKRTEKRTPYKYMLDLYDDAAMLALIQQEADGKIEIKSMKQIKDAPDLVKVAYDEIKITANHPVVEFIPASELRYTPDESELQNCKFVAQRKVVTGDYLKRKERDGIYKNIDEAIESYGQGNTMPTALEYRNDPDKSYQYKIPRDDDNATKRFELYEAYLWVDYNNDGVLENLIVHAIGDNLIRVAKNDFEFPPFFICSAFYDPNKVFSEESFVDNLEQLQDLKTATIRQIIVNMAKNNSPRIFVDERKVDMDALMNNEEIIAMSGNPAEAVFVPPQLALSSVSMQMVQYAQNEVESQSGSTRYNQGLDSNSLNQTATGIVSILGQAEKKNKVIARAIAEKFLIPIYRFLILLNQKYLEDEQIIRLVNRNVNIRRDSIDIDYDLTINVGQGAGTKEAQIQYLQYTLQQIYPVLSAQGIVNAKSWYNLVSKLLETLGLRDVSQYLLDPTSQEAQQAAQLAQEQKAAEQADALQKALQLSIAKSSVPRITLDVTKLPPDVQKDYIKDKLGIETTEQEIAEHELMRE